MWRHRKLADTRIRVLDTWCQLDKSGALVVPDPVPDRIQEALTRHPDWKHEGAQGSKPVATTDEAPEGGAEERELPGEVHALNVKELRELAVRLDINLADAKRRDDILAAIATSDAGDAELVAVSVAIDQE